MMRAASRHLGELLPATEGGVKGVAFALGALVLPIGRPRVRESSGELHSEGQTRVEVVEDLIGLAVPEDAAVLLARAADGADARQRDGHGFCQALKDEVERLHPHGDGGINLARLLDDMDALLETIFAPKVLVEIDLGLTNDLEVRVNNDTWRGISYGPPARRRKGVPLSCWVDRSKPRYRGFESAGSAGELERDRARKGIVDGGRRGGRDENWLRRRRMRSVKTACLSGDRSSSRRVEEASWRSQWIMESR